MRRGIAIAALILAAAACEPALAPVPPVGETRIDCRGVPPQQCQQALAEARESSHLPVIALKVRCAALPCTFQQGQLEVEAQYADGSTMGWGSAWGEGVPEPMPVDPVPPEPAVPLPVEPVCIGVQQS